MLHSYILYLNIENWLTRYSRLELQKINRIQLIWLNSVELVGHFTNHHNQINHLKEKMQSDLNHMSRLRLRSDFSWNSVSVLLKSLTPELSDLPLERLRTAIT